MKKIILTALIVLFGFLAFNASAANVNRNKWKIEGIYQLNVDNQDENIYFIFLPNNKFLFINAHKGLILKGEYQPSSDKDWPTGKVLFFEQNKTLGFAIDFKNYTLPPRVEIKDDKQIFYFFKKDITFEDLMYSLAE